VLQEVVPEPNIVARFKTKYLFPLKVLGWLRNCFDWISLKNIWRFEPLLIDANA